MAQKRILTIGSALVDVFISSNQFEITRAEQEIFTTRSTGGKLSVDSFKIKTGGGGGNTAVGFAKLGFETSCIAELGHDELADLVISDLEKHNVRIDTLIQERKEETGGSVLLVTSTGERTALVHRGAAALLDPSDISKESIKNQDWIHLASVAGRTQTIQTIFKLASQYGVGISWNPGQAELEAMIQDVPGFKADAADFTKQQSESHPVKVLLLNQQEWTFIEQIQESITSIIPRIVVTDGVHGGRVYDKNSSSPFEYQASQVNAVDNTGAGDAFAVGFIAAQLLGHSLSISADWGKRNSASVVQVIGAKDGLLTLQEIA